MLATIQFRIFLYFHLLPKNVKTKINDPTRHWFLSQTNPVQTFPPYFPKIYRNITLHLRLGLPSGLLFRIFQPKFAMHFSSLPCVIHAPSILSSLIQST